MKKKKKYRALGTCGAISKGLTFVSLESLKEIRAQKIFEDIMVENILNLVKDILLHNHEA